MKKTPFVVVVGGMNLDIQARSLRPFNPGDSNPGSLSEVPGGVGRNIAENLVRLGAKVELVSTLGDDHNSRILEDSCESIGIGLGSVLRLEGEEASRYLCILDSDGRLVGAVAAMDGIERLIPERLAERSKVLDKAELIVVDANVSEASIAWLARRYPKDSGGPLLCFDPVSARKAPKGAASLGAFAFAKPNLAEAAVLAGVAASVGGRSAVLDAAGLAALLRERGLGEAFVSLGTEGLVAEGRGSGGQGEVWIARPSRALATVNTSGAGDAAVAALAWGLLEGYTFGERCAFAMAASAIAASSLSPVNPAICADLLVETAKGIERERLS